MRPPNVPADPSTTYKHDGWEGWGQWLGTGNTRNTTQFLPFDEALAVTRSLGLASQKEWQVWCKEGIRPPNVPSHPQQTYKHNGWQGWGHWLGTGNIHSKQFLPFDEALAVARTLGLASQKEWKVWRKEGMRPPNVPSAPDTVYTHDGWQGWGHWLGSSNLSTKHFLPFGEALAVAQSLGLTNMREWRVWSKKGMRPPNVPSHPDTTHKHDGWEGWGHWLGTGNTRNPERSLPFGEALTVARSLRLTSSTEWRLWCKTGTRPASVPAAPDQVYVHDVWLGFGHWLGSSNLTTKQFLPFDEALAVARSLGLANSREWNVWSKAGMRPPNVPSNPNKTYTHGGWQGWGHWLGTGNLVTKQFLPFEEALVVAQSLKLAGEADWRVWCKEGMRPPNVPSQPSQVYKHDGWRGWGHWLGTGNIQCGTEQSQPFGEALAVVRSLGLASQFEWRAWCKEGMRPANVPAQPGKVYKHTGWQGWGHWLGTGNTPRNLPSEKFLPFDEALAVACSLRLASSTEWKAWCKSGVRPPNVPADPSRVYMHNGWV